MKISIEATIDELCSLGLVKFNNGEYALADDLKSADINITTDAPIKSATTHVKIADEELSQIVKLAQELLGKPVSKSDYETLVWICDNLNLSAEVVLMCIEHCVNLGKRSMKYIEQVAISWDEQGITTIEDVEHIVEAPPRDLEKLKANLKRIFQINDRELTILESGYIESWIIKSHMSEDMIALAYEYCVINTGKLSFRYMDGIISSWISSGITTLEQAEAEHNNHQSKETPVEKTTPEDSTIDSDMLSKIMELGK